MIFDRSKAVFKYITTNLVMWLPRCICDEFAERIGCGVRKHCEVLVRIHKNLVRFGHRITKMLEVQAFDGARENAVHSLDVNLDFGADTIRYAASTFCEVVKH